MPEENLLQADLPLQQTETSYLPSNFPHFCDLWHF